MNLKVLKPFLGLHVSNLIVIGVGGFGSVVKARNKLDGRIYAIKKIKFGRTDRRFVEKVLREVITLSRLHHKHVVRYYQAWIDIADEDDDFEPSKDLSDFSRPITRPDL